jgi:transposase
MNAVKYARGDKRTINKLIRLRNDALHDKAPRVALRIQGVLLSLDRHSIGEISHLLRIHRSSVDSWVSAWNEHGEKSLLEGYRSGRPTRLTQPDIERLCDIIESGPVAYGLNTGVWTSPIISYVIGEEFNISYHPGHVRKILKKIGFSVQRPTTELVRADKKTQNRWIRHTYPNLKKKHKKKMR